MGEDTGGFMNASIDAAASGDTDHKIAVSSGKQDKSRCSCEELILCRIQKVCCK